MGFDGSNAVVSDRNCRSCNTAEGAYVCRWEVFGGTYTRILFGTEHADMPFVRHIDEVKYVRRLSNCFQKGTYTGPLDLECCCFHKALDIYYLVHNDE